MSRDLRVVDGSVISANPGVTLNRNLTNLVLFDIDGTLMRAHGAGIDALVAAGREAFGERFSLSGVDCAGNLDPLIVTEAASKSGVTIDALGFERFRSAYAPILTRLLQESREAEALAGAIDAVLSVRGRADSVAGLLTGNYDNTAEIKLRHVGFDFEWFEVGAFGDMASTRAELVPVAVERFQGRFGEEPRRVVIVGDTPRDVACARANGCPVLAVATGRFSMEELRAAGADHVVANLTNPEPLLSLLAS